MVKQKEIKKQARKLFKDPGVQEKSKKAARLIFKNRKLFPIAVFEVLKFIRKNKRE